MRTPLALTLGDPAGIGPDITLAAWRGRDEHKLDPFVVVGDADALRARADQLGIDVTIEQVASFAEGRDAFEGALPVRHAALSVPAEAGLPNAANARAIISAIGDCVAAVHRGEAAAIVTNPIAKHVLYGAGFSHPGQTEFLGALADRYWPMTASDDARLPVMMLASEALTVVPLTIHEPIARVPAMITVPRLTAVARTVCESLSKDFALTRPRVSITGLNPHAGEFGTIGTEERDVIMPAIDRLRDEGFDVRGPFSADTLFHAEARESYDAVVTMYHDQALIPIKTLAFDTGVNTTIGLPFVRTSPDHGTAFGLAGKGEARAQSLIAAIQLASRMVRNRSARHGRAR